eukprot:TRINITY_DN33673_c0_g1_i1.p1 TRINITY_DN33673_c0_g1~~TRINITY_DN33673_c0_g1_i1.p1  ORF type:complete len:628 (+),score=119.59 TRINITY_DN33673_c0_g1_i1:272-1885(+)
MMTGDLVTQYLEKQKGHVPSSQLVMFRQAIYSRRCIFLIDDVDATGKMRPRIEAHMVKLVQAGHRVVATLRAASVAGASPGVQSAFGLLKLLPLDEVRQRVLVGQRLAPHEAAELVATEASAIADGNPAMLHLLGATAKLAGGRLTGDGTPADAYSAVVTAAIAHVGLDGQRAEDAARRLIGHIAFEAQRRGLTSFHQSDLRQFLSDDELRTWDTLQAVTGANRFPLLTARMEVDRGEVLQFVHISLQEFLFAVRAAKHLGDGDEIERKTASSAGPNDMLPGLQTLLSEPRWTRALDFLSGGYPAQCSSWVRRGVATWEQRRGPLEVSALHLAVQRRLLNVVRMLLDQGASPTGIQCRSRHLYGSLEETPLHNAAGRGDAAAVELLLDRRADVGGFQGARVAPGGGRRETTPLFCASERGHLAVAALLLRRGAPVQGQQCGGGGAGGGSAGGMTGPRTCADAARSEDMRRLLRSAEAVSEMQRPQTSAARAVAAAVAAPGARPPTGLASGEIRSHTGSALAKTAEVPEPALPLSSST